MYNSSTRDSYDLFIPHPHPQEPQGPPFSEDRVSLNLLVTSIARPVRLIAADLCEVLGSTFLLTAFVYVRMEVIFGSCAFQSKSCQETCKAVR